MKAKEIMKFMMCGYVSSEQCGISILESTNDFSTYFCDLCDDGKAIDGEFFWFWIDNFNHELDRDKLLSFGTQKNADAELPTKTGWITLVKIED